MDATDKFPYRNIRIANEEIIILQRTLNLINRRALMYREFLKVLIAELQAAKDEFDAARCMRLVRRIEKLLGDGK